MTMADFRSPFSSSTAPPKHGTPGNRGSTGLQQAQREGLEEVAANAAYSFNGQHEPTSTVSKRARLRGGQRRRDDLTTTTPSGEARIRWWRIPACCSRVLLPGQARLNVQRRSLSTRAGPGEEVIGQPSYLKRAWQSIVTFARFVGPGFLVAVAYIDPGNYATDISAGALYRFRLLFVVLLSNLIAIFLQALCIKLGTVTGLNLAEACRAFLPRWLNYVLYAFAEVAIIATDLAEVIGTAIAINLLIPQVPLVAGCAISILDVMIILLFYDPKGSMRALRAFEAFVVALVIAVVVCFCIQMSFIRNTSVGEVFKGYLPSAAIVQQQGLYQACGILGATVMPHSLYLGSGMPQARLKEYDVKQGLHPTESPMASEASDKITYVPSLAAIRHCLKYSIAELAISLFTFALFVNSAILIIAGASLYGSQDAQGDDIFAIHSLITQSLGKGAGILFALALLLSGVSAGIVCTIAGQMVSEGAINWHMRPWLRRLMTRSISITPSIIVAGAVGREGLDAALNASQVALSIVLPFVSAPLIYFTCMNKYMSVGAGRSHPHDEGDDMHPSNMARRDPILDDGPHVTKMANSIPVIIIAILVWLVIAAMNIANLVLLGLGKE
ncbi:natural resistance-associated macrophage protein-domain-containing protein [Coniella lustricola]|uniref:Natural resistance-associated macrophage protein-domain-containing protein n=1 Tax=Coniella lustricola TaxID=2025994 RepID=A0A2T3A1B5_9PEZI|nr:natural resistance-associated macrophage protein-domain-containing protein [Coniella lustricola]